MENPENYWSDRYRQGNTPWDAGGITTPLKTYFDQFGWLPNDDAYFGYDVMNFITYGLNKWLFII